MQAIRLADPGDTLLDTTVAGILAGAAAASPDRTALVAGVPEHAARRRWSYADLAVEVERAASVLAAGFRPGERIAVFAPSLPESLMLTYAAATAGLVLVPVNPALRAAELRHVLAGSGAAGVFCVDSHRGTPVAAVVDAARTDLPGVRTVVRFEDWDAWCTGPTASLVGRAPAPDDVAQIIFTSGTTGAPKGARLSHRAMTNAARGAAIRFGIRPGDVHIDTMPLSHVGGQEVAMEICQLHATAVLVAAFEPGLVLELIESEGGTLTAGVPTMLVAMIDHPEFASRDLSSLRTLSSGGAVVPADLVRHIEAALGVEFVIVFGQTEACGFISQTSLGDSAEDKASTLGHPLPGLDARVVDPATDDVVAVGEVGELQVRGGTVMAGYHDLPDATAESITVDGWLRTGDLVTMDQRGYLRIAGRLKEMVVSGGLNLFPVEIEAVIQSHPRVAQAAVVGVPDRRWGEAAVAVVRPVPDAEIDVGELEAWVRERLAGYKVPKRWVVRDELPVTAFGKVRKFVLRDELGRGESSSRGSPERA